nr:hypothetical protein [Tanacetum cinerariifolium]
DLWVEEVISVKGVPWVGNGGVSGVSLFVVSSSNDKNGKTAGNGSIWPDDGSLDGSDSVSDAEVGPLPVQQLAVRHFVDHSSSDYFSLDDSARDSSSDSSSEASSNFHSDALFDSSSRHSLSYHSSPDLPSTSARPSRKRPRSPMTSVLALPPIFRALSPVRVDLIPSPKRVRDSGYLADVEIGPRETSLRDDVITRGSDEPHLEQDIDPVIQAKIDEYEIEMGVRGPVEVKVERITHPAMPENIPEPAQEGAVEVTYETLRDLVQRFHDHTEAILVHRVEVIEGVERERLRGTMSVERQRVDRLQRSMNMPNTQSGASMTREEVEELVARRVAEEIKARKAARNLKTLNENGDEQEGENGGNGNGGNGGNGNRENGGNRNGGN